MHQDCMHPLIVLCFHVVEIPRNPRPEAARHLVTLHIIQRACVHASKCSVRMQSSRVDQGRVTRGHACSMYLCVVCACVCVCVEGVGSECVYGVSGVLLRLAYTYQCRHLRETYIHTYLYTYINLCQLTSLTLHSVCQLTWRTLSKKKRFCNPDVAIIIKNRIHVYKELCCTCLHVLLSHYMA